MGTEFDNVQGLPVSFPISGTIGANDVGSSLTVGGTGNTQYYVPTGFRFRPLYLTVGLAGAVSAGSIRIYCRDGTTEIAGPTVTLTDADRGSDTARLHEGPGVAAGHVIDVAEDTTSDFAGAAGVAGVLAGVLVPA